jgi:flagellar biosynthesis chaperone FliJ
MITDLRGFRYALAPLAELEASRLRMAELELSQAAARCAEAADALERSRVAVQQFVTDLAGHGRERVDLAFRQLATRYVLDLNRAVERMQARVAAFEAEREQAFGAWEACRHRVEQLNRHRDAAREDYAREASARQFAQADDDWIMGRHRREKTHDDH